MSDPAELPGPEHTILCKRIGTAARVCREHLSGDALVSASELLDQAMTAIEQGRGADAAAALDRLVACHIVAPARSA